MANILPVNNMIDKPDYLAAAQQGLQFGTQLRQQREQRADEATLRNLAPQVIAGDPGATAQAAVISPDAAGKYRDAGDSIARRAEGFVRMMEDADRTNPQQAQSLWQTYGVPFARQFSQGTEPTANWTEAKPMLANLKARIEMAKASQGGGQPDVKVVGNALVDPTGRELYRAPEQPRYFQTDQGLIRIGPNGPEEVRLDANGQPMPQAPQAPPASGDVFASLKTSVPGLRVTDEGIRTPEENASLPNSVPNSYHLSGRAIDIGRPTAEQQAGITQWAAANGFEVIHNYQDGHWHLEPRGGSGGTGGGGGQGPGRRLMPATSVADRERLRLAQEAADRAAAADQRAAEAAARARLGNPPPGMRWNADMTAVENIPGAPPPAAGKVTEDQAKAAGWVNQATNAYKNMEKALQDEPAANEPGFIETYIPNDEIANRSRSDARQRYVNGASAFSEAILRAATGAGVNEQEARQKIAEVTPQRGDSQGLRDQKRAALEVYLQSLRQRAGNALQQGGGGASSAPTVIRYDAQGNRL